MRHLFDFGISQEDPNSELSVLNLQPADRLLCVASGGEIPLSLLSLRPDIHITAVDISASQLILCRLKMIASTVLPFPENGNFLGYSAGLPKWRREVYNDYVRPHLSVDDQKFWNNHIDAIEKGAINSGRFEKYIKKLQPLARSIIGRKNMSLLYSCTSVEEQQNIFDNHIARRKALRWLFSIAFHPLIYKRRGIRSQALQHATEKTGGLFFSRFRSFCTATLVSKNYFFQYFLSGQCLHKEALPEYLQPQNQPAYAAACRNVIWKCSSLEQELSAKPAGTYNKIHLSNIGDWLSKEDFIQLEKIILEKSAGCEKICYRFLQKNHFDENNKLIGYNMKKIDVEKTDRFPFYTVLSIERNG